MKDKIKTIDCTPTWLSLVPFMTMTLEDESSKPESRKIIKEQITRMAKVADEYIRVTKPMIEVNPDAELITIGVKQDEETGTLRIITAEGKTVFFTAEQHPALYNILTDAIKPKQ